LSALIDVWDTETFDQGLISELRAMDFVNQLIDDALASGGIGEQHLGDLILVFGPVDIAVSDLDAIVPARRLIGMKLRVIDTVVEHVAECLFPIEDRHLILLTATPHSGVESAFRSLLALLRPQFGSRETSSLTEPQRIELARHFVQRTLRDIEHDWEGEHCFPKRDSSDETYHLSRAYQELFIKTYEFCSEIVRAGEQLDQRQQRVRYWGALALGLTGGMRQSVLLLLLPLWLGCAQVASDS